jgi:hypothetical protein
MRPADLGFSMPAEWAPHAGCWMAWPKRVELWQEHLEAAREDYIRVARAIAAYEPLTMIAHPEQASRGGQEVRSFDQGRLAAHRRLMAARFGSHFHRRSCGQTCGRSFYLQRMGQQVSAPRSRCGPG